MHRTRPSGHLLAAVAVAAVVAGCGTTVPVVNGAAIAGDGLTQPGQTLATSGTGGTDGTGLTTGSTTTVPGSSTGTTVTPLGGGSAGAPPSTSTAGATTPGRTVTAAAAGPATKGFGWDAKKVYVGVPTADDFNAASKAAGANFDNGDVHAFFEAIQADVNRNGGLLGRALEIVYRDAPTSDYTTNGSVVAQAVCSYFTQDRPVVAVINGFPQLDAQGNFHSCLQKKAVTLLTFTNTVYSDADYQRLGPLLLSGASISTDLLVPTLVNGLDRQGYFSGWDTTRGAPSNDKARVGLLLADDPAGRNVGQLLKKQLARIGEQVVEEFYYPPAGSGTQSQAEVLAFTSAQVTHVLKLPPVEAEIALFQRQAENQRYRPRYGLTSFDLPVTVEQNPAIAPPAQQVGSMGVGWQPLNDVNATKDVGPMPGSKRCLAALKARNQSFSSSQRRAAFVAALICDAIYLLRDAMGASNGYSGQDVVRALPTVGPKFTPAGTFGSVLSGQDRGLPGFYRDLRYDAACSCFGYVGGNRPFSR